MATAIRTAFNGLLLFVPLLIVIRETQRASVRGTAMELPNQFPQLYRTADEFAKHEISLADRAFPRARG